MSENEILALREFTLGYDGLPVVHKVSLMLRPGEILGVIGPNGSGKSTLLRGTLGLVDHLGGTVVFRGVPAARLDPELLGSDGGVGFVPQNSVVFSSLSIRDHLRIGGLKLPPGVLPERLRWAGAFLGDLEERIDDPAGNLSGGQQRIVGLVRALVSRPALILMDEPSIGLDGKHRQQLYEMLDKLREEAGISFLVVEQHVASLFEIADRFLVLKEGKVVLEDDAGKYRGRLEEIWRYYT